MQYAYNGKYNICQMKKQVKSLWAVESNISDPVAEIFSQYLPGLKDLAGIKHWGRFFYAANHCSAKIALLYL